MADMENLSAEELEQIAGGASSTSYKSAVVKGTTYYLALRSEPVYDDKNEIGKLHNGDVIKVRTDLKTGPYIYAKALGKQGWVDSNYLTIK